MPLTYGLRSARDLLGKLERDAQLLRNGVSSDRFFNFVVTAYSLVDWVKNDPNVPPPARAAAKTLRNTTWIKMCGNLANASKHFLLDPNRHPSPTVSGAGSAQGFGVGRFGNSGYGEGEEVICVELRNGVRIDGIDFMERVLRKWNLFFTKHQL